MANKFPDIPSPDSLKKEVDSTLQWNAPSPRVPKPLRRWPFITTHCLASLLTAFICWIVLDKSSLNPSSTSPKTKTLTCGNNTAEARALGCEFDPLTVAWIPAPCINHESTQQFMAEYPWLAYSDKTSFEVIDQTQMAEYIAPSYYYTSEREHAVHCLFAMEKLHRGYLRSNNGLYIDSESSMLMHTKHCVGVVKKAIDREPDKLERLATRNTVALLTCEVEA